jgi:hypothetical protein
MRLAFAVLLVLSSSLVSGEELGLNPKASNPPAPPALPAAKTPSDKELARKSLIVIGEDNFQVFCDGAEPAESKSKWIAGIKCEKFAVATDENQFARLELTNCTFEMPDGITGQAAKIEFDFETNELAMSGNENVGLVLKGKHFDRIVYASRIVVKTLPSADAKIPVQQITVHN